MPRLSSVVVGWIWLITAPVVTAGQPGTAGLPRSVVSRIAADYSIITEVSVSSPYLGQQFSILYRLHALHPPAAVDIDPQQFPGFWTEIVPVPRESAAAARPARGRDGFEYLLRQVIAFPLLEGSRFLPALSVKIKRAEQSAERGGDWDLTGVSEPISLEIAPLPQKPQSDRDLYLVGRVEGNLSETKEKGSPWRLEIQGTANLALFHPLEWLTPLPGVRYRARLAAADAVSQTIDKQGNRQVLLFQRQSWLIDLSGNTGDRRRQDLRLPVFDPQQKVWQELRFAGSDPSASELEPDSFLPAGSKDKHTTARHLMPDLPVRLLLIVLAAVLPALLLWRATRGRRFRKKTSEEQNLPAAGPGQEAAPRVFLEAAHKLLMQVAEEKGRDHNLGSRDELLDQCWMSVQYYRFGKQPLPAEIRSKISVALGQLSEQRAGQAR